MKTNKSVMAYHFTGNTLRNGDPIPRIGRWIKHEGKIIACESGLHASEHPFDALQYALGPILHLVELRGEIVTHGNPVDKLVGRERKIVKSVIATPILRRFAQLSALSVAHLWNAPDLVLDYLYTGNEELMAATWAVTAWAVEGNAAGNIAAGFAAGNASRAVAWAAVETVTAWAAAKAAAGDASRAVAWAAARAAAGAAHQQEMRDLFASLVNEAFNEEGSHHVK